MAGTRDKLVIIGDGETAELAYDYFTNDTYFEVVGFSAEQRFIKNKTLLGLPVVPLEVLEDSFDPKAIKAFVAISFTQLNRLRQRLLNVVKSKGYSLCSYISPKAFVGQGVSIGHNCLILENVSIQRGALIGDNVTIWSGSSIGHRTQIGNNCFLASHVAISGFCNIGDSCFFGVNSCTANNIKIAEDCLVGAGAVLVNDAPAGRIYVGNPAKPLHDKTTTKFITGEENI